MYNNYLWDVFKSLQENNLPLYVDVFNETEENVPSSYLYLDTMVSNRPYVIGDGFPLLRVIDFTLSIHSTSITRLKEIAAKVEEKMQELDFSYTQLSTNRDPSSGYYSTIFISSYTRQLQRGQ